MHVRYKILFVFALLGSSKLRAQTQDKGQFSGNLLMNYQKYIRDTTIGANTRVYKENTASTDVWLFLQYRYNGYNFIVRYDGFNNSPLLNPQDAYTNHGIGFWQINKKIQHLDITVGSFYDQFGSGILFRAYEQRQLGIDYSIQGLRMAYDINSNWRVKGFSGNQKGNITNRFGFAPQVISGLNLEGNISLGSNNLQVGASAINRNLDMETMKDIVSTLNTYDKVDQFIPKYNMYGFNGYFTLSAGNFTWNVEGNYKTPEAIVDITDSKYKLKSGKALYTSISWGKSKIKLGKTFFNIGVNIQARHVDYFMFRTSPRESLLNGMVSYLPSLTKQNTYRLMARYNAPAQDVGEDGIQGEVELKVGNNTRIAFNTSFVQSAKANGKFDTTSNSLNPVTLFRELNGEVIQNIGKDKLKLGLQSIVYNQAIYELEPDYETVTTITPFIEWLHKTAKGKTLRIEAQYLHTKQDQGSFANMMVEYYFSKDFSMSVGDMVNVQPHRYEKMKLTISDKMLHYPTIFMSYIHQNSVFTLAFVKQQTGVNCSGGICRVEPAFSGIRFTTSTTF